MSNEDHLEQFYIKWFDNGGYDKAIGSAFLHGGNKSELCD
jgi:hypothetical protein